MPTRIDKLSEQDLKDAMYDLTRREYVDLVPEQYIRQIINERPSELALRILKRRKISCVEKHQGHWIQSKERELAHSS